MWLLLYVAQNFADPLHIRPTNVEYATSLRIVEHLQRWVANSLNRYVSLKWISVAWRNDWINFLGLLAGDYWIEPYTRDDYQISILETTRSENWRKQAWIPPWQWSLVREIEKSYVEAKVSTLGIFLQVHSWLSSRLAKTDLMPANHFKVKQTRFGKWLK